MGASDIQFTIGGDGTPILNEVDRVTKSIETKLSGIKGSFFDPAAAEAQASRVAAAAKKAALVVETAKVSSVQSAAAKIVRLETQASNARIAKAKQTATLIAAANARVATASKVANIAIAASALKASAAQHKLASSVDSGRAAVSKASFVNQGYVKKLRRLVVGADKASKGLDHVAHSTKSVSKAGAGMASLVGGLSRVVAIVQGPLGPVAGRLTALATGIRQIGLSMLAFGGVMAGLRAIINRAIPAAIDLQRTQTVLAASTVDAGRSFSFVISEARRTGQGFSMLARSYGQLAAAAKGTVLQGTGVEKIFRAVNTAALALRLDIHQTAGALKAMEQMISKGTVSSEELRQQLGERLPGAFRAAADAMGKSTAVFSKLLAQGKILAIDLLPKLADVLENRYADAANKASRNLGTALGKLSVESDILFGTLVSSDQLSVFAAQVDKLTTLMKELSGSTEHLANVLGTLAAVVAGAGTLAVLLIFKKMLPSVENFSIGVKGAAKEGKALFRILSKVGNIASFVTLFSPVGLAKAALVGLVKGLWKMAPAIATATAAWWSFGAAQDSVIEAAKKAVPLSEIDTLAARIKALQDDITAKTDAMSRAVATNSAALEANRRAGLDSSRIIKLQAKHRKEGTAQLAAYNAELNILLGTQKELGVEGAVASSVKAVSSKFASSRLAGIDKTLGNSGDKSKNEKLLINVKSAKMALEGEKKAILRAINKKGGGLKADDPLMQQLRGSKKNLRRINNDINAVQGLIAHDNAVTLQKLKTKHAAMLQRMAQFGVKSGTLAAARLKHEQKIATANAAFDLATLNDTSHKKTAQIKQQLKDTKAVADAAFNKEKRTINTKAKQRLALLKSEIAIFGKTKGSMERLIARQSRARLMLQNKQELEIIGGHSDAVLLVQQKLQRDLLALKQGEARDALGASLASSAGGDRSSGSSSGRQVAANNATTAGLKQDIARFNGSGESGGEQASRHLKQQGTALQVSFDAEQQARAENFTLAYSRLDDSNQSTAQLEADYRANELVKMSEFEQQKTQLQLDAAQLRGQQINDGRGHFAALFNKNQQTDLKGMSDSLSAFYEESKGFAEADAKGKLDIASKGFGMLAGMMEGHSKRAFKIGKIAAVAQATVDGIAAVMKASTSAPYPFNIPMMVGMAALATSNVQKILATKYGGGGAKAATSGGGRGSTKRTLITPASFNPRFVQSTHPYSADAKGKLAPAAKKAAAYAPSPGKASIIGGAVGLSAKSTLGTLATSNPNFARSTRSYSSDSKVKLHIVQYINAPGATAGTAAQIQQAAALGAQQAVAHVANDFATNGQLRQTLAV